MTIIVNLDGFKKVLILTSPKDIRPLFRAIMSAEVMMEEEI